MSMTPREILDANLSGITVDSALFPNDPTADNNEVRANVETLIELLANREPGLALTGLNLDEITPAARISLVAILVALKATIPAVP